MFKLFSYFFCLVKVFCFACRVWRVLKTMRELATYYKFSICLKTLVLFLDKIQYVFILIIQNSLKNVFVCIFNLAFVLKCRNICNKTLDIKRMPHFCM